MILRSFVSTQNRRVTDGRTDGLVVAGSRCIAATANLFVVNNVRRL